MPPRPHVGQARRVPIWLSLPTFVGLASRRPHQVPATIFLAGRHLRLSASATAPSSLVARSLIVLPASLVGVRVGIDFCVAHASLARSLAAGSLGGSRIAAAWEPSCSVAIVENRNQELHRM